MNRSALRYKLYKYSIEENFTSAQRDVILSESFLSKVGAFLGLPGQVGGALANAFKNSEVSSLSKSLKKNFEDLKSVASKLDNGDQIVAGILKSLLDDSGFNPSNIAKVDLSKIGGKQDSGAQQSGPVTSAEVDKNPAAATNLVAALTDKKPDEVAAVIDKKKPNAAAVSKTIGNAIAPNIGLDADKATKIVKALMDTGHLVFEGYRPVMITPDPIMERWQQLAGIDTLFEAGPVSSKGAPAPAAKAPTAKAPAAKAPAKKGKPAPKKAGGGTKPKPVAKKDATSTGKPQQTGDKPTQPTSQPAKPGQPQQQDAQKGQADKEKQQKSGEKKTDPNIDALKKEFEKPLKDIRGKVKEEDASDEDVIKVFKVIIAAGGEGKGPEIK